MSQTIEIENVDAIQRLSIPIPATGGVVVLTGPNGSGKTSALKAISRLTGGREQLTVRDGERQGTVRLGTLKMTVGRTTRKSGGEELEIQSLEGRFDVGRFCDPGIQDPEAADAKRIKDLVGLSGESANPALFYDLAGGPEAFRSIVPSEDLETDDLVLMASRVKRRLEAEARRHEAQAETANRDAHAFRLQAEGVESTAVGDPQALQAQLETAIRAESDLRNRAQSAERLRRSAEQAQAALTEALVRYRGPSEAEGEAGLEDAEAEEAMAREKAREAERALELAREKVKAAVQAREAARREAESAKSHATLVASWRGQIDQAANVLPVERAEIEQAAQSVRKAREAVELGALVRNAHEAARKATQAEEAAAEHRKSAGKRREQAALVDEVLSSLVGRFCTRLRVEGGRLMTQTGRRKTYFAELSAGEKRRLGLDVAIDVVGEHGRLTMDEWPTLQPAARREVCEHVVSRRAVLVATEAADEPLHVEVFSDAR